MRRLIAVAAIAFVLMMTTSVYTQSSSRAAAGSQASYTAAQAERGKVVYGQVCATCHLANLRGKCSAEELSSPSYVCGATGNAPPLVGASFMKRFHSVGDLYSRVKWTMPPDRQNSLSAADYLSVVAYLLQANAGDAGSQELKAGTALKTMLVSDIGRGRATTAKVAEPLNSVGISRAYYTDAQAERGRGYFYGSCGACHTAEPGAQNGTMPRSSGLGWHRGADNSLALFVGERWLSSVSGIPGRPQRWSTVADLYNKIHTTQPAYDVAGLSSQTYLDVLAFLLKQNGFPAGRANMCSSENLTPPNTGCWSVSARDSIPKAARRFGVSMMRSEKNSLIRIRNPPTLTGRERRLPHWTALSNR
jgi:cytochrome c2